MAKLKAVISKEDHDQLAETLKELYVEKDGKFILDSDHEDVTGLKNTVAALRKERSTAEAELAKFKDIGDVDKAKAALAKVQELEEQEAKKSGEWEKLKLQMVERHATEKADLNQKLKDMEKDVESLVVDREIVTVLSDPEIGGKVKALLPHMKTRVKAIKEGGQWKPIVHNGDGTPSIADGSGAPQTLKGLALEMRKDPDFAPLFVSQARGGGGAPPGGAAAGGGGGSKVAKKGDQAALAANFADIAAGKVAVED
jgi:predicted RNase H-like nuclease (RuvC/YqgF family)